MHRQRRHVSFISAAVVAAPLIVAGLLLPSGSAAAAPLGGPVILGGDDLTDHGNAVDNDNNGSCETMVDGWNYIQKALENISPQVTRTNDGTVAALGSSDENATCDFGSLFGGAGAAIEAAAGAAGLSVTFYDGPDAINEFFAAVRAGTANPRIVWIAGNGAGNDLDSDESTALANNATTIGDFVNAGGGLLSHGTEYGWLSGLLPGVSTVDSGSSDDLYLTAAGQSSFPGLTNTEVNAGPWHNHFECTGDPGNGATSDCFGGLQVLTASSSVDDQNGRDAAVIIGGAAAQLPGSISLDPGEAWNNPTTSPNHSVKATVRDDSGAVLPGKTVTFSVVSGPNAGAGGSATTNASGEATFAYSSNGAEGTDTIQASFVDDTGATRSTQASKVWDKTRPACSFVATRTNPAETELSVRDPLAGLQSISASPTVNAVVTIDPAAYQGLTSAVKVVVSRQNEAQVARARIAITDRAGNVGYCTLSGYVKA